MKKHYITAVTDLLLKGGDVDAVLANLKTVLVRKGHEKLHTSILRGVLTELTVRKDLHTPFVFVASEADIARFREAITETLQTLNAPVGEMQVTVDDTLIGGYIATHEGKLINRSYKEKLVSLYRSITK